LHIGVPKKEELKLAVKKITVVEKEGRKRRRNENKKIPSYFHFSFSPF